MPTFADPATIATLAIAVVTLALVLVTLRQARLARHALELSIRPLLAEALPNFQGPNDDYIQFGAPGRQGYSVRTGALEYQVTPTTFKVSIAFRNIGAGIAVILGAETVPAIASSGSLVVTRKFVPVGEQVRVNISSLTSSSDLARFTTEWWAMEGFVIAITYSDADGKHSLTSRATIKQAATQGPWVAEIAIAHSGKKKPFAVGRSSI